MIEIVVFSFCLGFGIFVGFKILKDKNLKLSKEQKTQNKRKKQVYRYSNCLSLTEEGYVRLKDGSFLVGFKFHALPSLWNQEKIDELCDRMAQFLASQFPVKCCFQFRTLVNRNNLNFLEKVEIKSNDESRILKQSNHEHLSNLAKLGFIRDIKFSLWVYVKAKTKGDIDSDLIVNFLDSIKYRDLSILSRRLLTRSRKAEEEAIGLCDQVVKIILREFPLKIELLSREEVFNALYLDYNINTNIPPLPPTTSWANLEEILCKESISFAGKWWLLHGNQLVAVLQLFSPPEKFVNAGMMRILTNNPALNFPFTVLVDFIPIEKEKVEKEISWNKWKLEVLARNRKIDKHQQRKYAEMEAVETELTFSHQNISKMRFKIIVYGDRIDTKEDLKKGIETLEKRVNDIIKYARRIWHGADLALEESIYLRELYETNLLGNMETEGKTGREVMEQNSSLVSFIPLEDSFEGIVQRPHTVKRTASGRPFYLNLWNNPLSQSPLVCILGASGSGKSSECASLILDVIASVENARCRILDFGGTYEDLCEVLNGKMIHFENEKPINLWWYPGLEEGEMPDENQYNILSEEVSILCSYDPTTETGRIKNSVVLRAIQEIYKDIVPRNRNSSIKYEPTLSTLIQKLETFPFSNALELEEARRIASMLRNYEKFKILNSPMHHEYKTLNKIEVVEMDSVLKFEKTIKSALVFRASVFVGRTVGVKINNEYAPTLVVYDEMHEYNDPSRPELKVVFRGLEKAVRKGRKTNVVTIIATHAYEDLADIHGLVNNAGIYIVGKQNQIDTLSKIRNWNQEITNAILGIKNFRGEVMQFMYSIGQGNEQMNELILSDLSSIFLWTITTTPDERNLKYKIKEMFPFLSPLERMAILADKYPRGLQSQPVNEQWLEELERLSKKINVNINFNQEQYKENNNIHTTDNNKHFEDVLIEIEKLFD
ncbi:MAG: hypothetical protein N2505_00215 [Endomicrobia bacterium]|nr:hypothetical protein [Endomicrobiia bacterium]